jgi:DNA-binding transcriptional regulator YdaS (Cro superfamily)
MVTVIERVIDVLGGTQAKAAEALEISQAHVSDLKTGALTISPELSVIVEIKTKGQVKRVDLLPDIFGDLDYNNSEAA